MTLQERFIESRGSPVMIGDQQVSQLYRIPLTKGVVQFRFISPPDADQGICVNAKGGAIELSDGTSCETLHIWHEPGRPEKAAHRLTCPAGEFLVWNVYRARHPDGETTVDCFTGDAGMVLLQEGPMRRRFGCSDWRTPFDPTALVVDVQWANEAPTRPDLHGDTIQLWTSGTNRPKRPKS
jgi:hypothetical protein